jgi:HAD superfamily hydrolase (TIGR01509 family)
MFDAVLLEFENVLASTADARRDALRRSLADDGLVLDDATYDGHCVGLAPRGAVVAAAAALGAALDATALDLAALRAERAFAELLGKGVVLAPGAREFVEHAHGRTRLALVTRASRREVEFVLGLAGLAAAFECVVSGDDVPAPEPEPAAHTTALARLARKRPVTAARAMALEDAPSGIRAAHAAGVRCVAVGPMPVYRAAAADAYVASLVGHTLGSLSRLVTRGQERVPHE